MGRTFSPDRFDRRCSSSEKIPNLATILSLGYGVVHRVTLSHVFENNKLFLFGGGVRYIEPFKGESLL